MLRNAGNEFIKDISKLKTRKERDIKEKFIVEGSSYIEEITNRDMIDFYVISESFARNEYKHSNFLEDVPIYLTTDEIFIKKLSDTISPQGTLAVCKKLKPKFKIEENSFFLMGEEIRDPGNMGTLIRTAAAAGCTGVLFSENSVDVYNPKTIRATAGNIFKIPVFENLNFKEIITTMKENNINIIATHLKGELFPYDVDFRKNCAILVGNEAKGLSKEIANMADFLLKIPMPGKTESLNASVAGSILIYEAVRQRLELK